MDIEALLFDFGGVVIDVDFNRAFQCWADHAGEQIETISSRYEVDDAYMRHERGEIHEAHYYQALRRQLAIEITDEQFAEGWNSVHVGEMPGIGSLLKQAGTTHSLFTFTNTNFSHMRVLEARFTDLFDSFQRIFASCDMGMRKPEAESFRHVAKETQTDPSQILFFDDLLENVASARAVGMQAVHVKSIADVEAAIAEL